MRHGSGQNAEAFPNIHLAWVFGRVIEIVKQGARSIRPELVTGFISFPSYHATAAAIFSWAMWPTRARWPVLLLNSCMAISAMLVGAHYLVDILAGLGVGAISVMLARTAAT